MRIMGNHIRNNYSFERSSCSVGSGDDAGVSARSEIDTRQRERGRSGIGGTIDDSGLTRLSGIKQAEDLRDAREALNALDTLEALQILDALESVETQKTQLIPLRLSSRKSLDDLLRDAAEALSALKTEIEAAGVQPQAGAGGIAKTTRPEASPGQRKSSGREKTSLSADRGSDKTTD